MDLVRLVYHSRSRLDPSRPATDQVNEIVEAAIARNRKDDVTGGLIYGDRWFIQVLEGPESAVTGTFERILRDDRHRDIALVAMAPIATRRYGAEPMAHASRNAANAPIFAHYTEGGAFDPMLISTERLIDLAEAVLIDPSEILGVGLRGDRINAA